MTDSSLPMKMLGEMVSVIETGSRPSGGASNAMFGMPSIGGENITLDGSLDLERVRYVDSHFFSSMRTGHLEPLDVLINKDGAQTGKVAMYRGEFTQAAINEHVYLLRGTNEIRQDYLFRVLLSENIQREIRSFITGSAQPGLNRRFINVLIPVPSLDQQNVVIEVLQNLDEVIQSTEDAIVKYEGIRAGLASDLLGHLIEGVGDRPVGDLLYKEFAGEWGENRERDGLCGCMVLRATNLTTNGINYATAARRFISKPKAIDKRLKKGDIILEAAGGGPGVPVGRVARFDPPDEQVYVVSNFFRTLRPLQSIDSRFLYYVLNYLWKQPEIWQVQQQTTGIINLKMADYLGIMITVPQIEEQQKITKMLDRIEVTILANRKQLEKLRQLRAGLADDLFSGKVRTVAE